MLHLRIDAASVGVPAKASSKPLRRVMHPCRQEAIFLKGRQHGFPQQDKDWTRTGLAAIRRASRPVFPDPPDPSCCCSSRPVRGRPGLHQGDSCAPAPEAGGNDRGAGKAGEIRSTRCQPQHRQAASARPAPSRGAETSGRRQASSIDQQADPTDGVCGRSGAAETAQDPRRRPLSESCRGQLRSVPVRHCFRRRTGCGEATRAEAEMKLPLTGPSGRNAAIVCCCCCVSARLSRQSRRAQSPAVFRGSPHPGPVPNQSAKGRRLRGYRG